MADGSTILIIRPGALGDTVLTEPVVAAVRAAWPVAHIELAGRTDFLPLLVGPGLANTCRSMDGPEFTSLFTRGPLDLPPYDLALAYLPDAGGVLAPRLSLRAGRSIVFDPRPPEGAGVHVADHLLRALEPLSVAPLRTAPQLARREEWAEQARAACELPEAYAVIHPGSGGRPKLWQPEKWAAVIHALRPLRVVVTCGPADEDIVHQVLSGLTGESNAAVVREQPVTTVAGLLAGARVYLGCDSGVTHLAAALGVPTLAVFGPTDPAVWAPRGEQVCVVRGADAATASVTPDAVLAAAADLRRTT